MTATTTNLPPLPQISGAISPKLHYLIFVLTSVVQGIPASPFAPSSLYSSFFFVLLSLFFLSLFFLSLCSSLFVLPLFILPFKDCKHFLNPSYFSKENDFEFLFSHSSTFSIFTIPCKEREMLEFSIPIINVD